MLKARHIVSLTLILFLTGCATSSDQITDANPADTSPAATAEGVVAGVWPGLPAAQIDEIYGPLVSALGEVLGTAVHLRTTSSFETFTEALASREFDIAVVQPFDYPGLVDSGYQPLARVDMPLIAILVATADLELDESGFGGIAALRMGTPPESSAMRRLLNASLIEEGLNPATLDIRAFSTHADCLGQLRLGTVDVCAIAPLPLRVFEATTGETLHVVAATEAVESIAIVARPGFDPDLSLQVQAFLLELNEDADGSLLLERLGIPGFVPIESSDFDRVRELLSSEPAG